MSFIKVIFTFLGLIVILGIGAVLFLSEATKNMPGVGDTCGGIANLQCREGQVCVMPRDEIYPDRSGVCEFNRMDLNNYIEVFRSAVK